MRRDPMPIVHTIVYDRYANKDNSLSSAQIQERKKWCVDTFGVPGRQASWWAHNSNGAWKLQFSRLEDVTLYLLRWS